MSIDNGYPLIWRRFSTFVFLFCTAWNINNKNFKTKRVLLFLLIQTHPKKRGEEPSSMVEMYYASRKKHVNNERPTSNILRNFWKNFEVEYIVLLNCGWSPCDPEVLVFNSVPVSILNSSFPVLPNVSMSNYILTLLRRQTFLNCKLVLQWNNFLKTKYSEHM